MAEEEGFEPSSPGAPVKRFSRPPHSTTLPPLRRGDAPPKGAPYQSEPGKRLAGLVWRRDGDSNPRYPFGAYTISNRAPSASSDISPHSVCLTNVKRLRSIAQLRCSLKKFFRVEAFAATVQRISRGMIQDAPHRRGWLTVKPSDSPVSLHCPFISRRNCVQ